MHLRKKNNFVLIYMYIIIVTPIWSPYQVTILVIGSKQKKDNNVNQYCMYIEVMVDCIIVTSRDINVRKESM